MAKQRNRCVLCDADLCKAFEIRARARKHARGEAKLDSMIYSCARPEARLESIILSCAPREVKSQGANFAATNWVVKVDVIRRNLLRYSACRITRGYCLCFGSFPIENFRRPPCPPYRSVRHFAFFFRLRIVLIVRHAQVCVQILVNFMTLCRIVQRVGLVESVLMWTVLSTGTIFINFQQYKILQHDQNSHRNCNPIFFGVWSDFLGARSREHIFGSCNNGMLQRFLLLKFFKPGC